MPARKQAGQKQESGKKHERGHGSAERMRGDDKGETGRKSNHTDRHARHGERTKG